MTGAAEPKLSAVVWPPYIGLGTDLSTWLPPDHRAQIRWRPMCTEHGVEAKCKCLDPRKATFAGKARAWVPSGTYTRFLFFHAPDGPMTAFKMLPHPFTQVFDGYIDIDPIINDNPIEGKMDAIAR